MRLLRLAVFSCLVGGYAGAASAQYGLYGSPDTLRLPQATVAESYPSTAYPGIAVPVTQAVPAPQLPASQPQSSPWQYPQTPAVAQPSSVAQQATTYSYAPHQAAGWNYPTSTPYQRVGQAAAAYPQNTAAQYPTAAHYQPPAQYETPSYPANRPYTVQQRMASTAARAHVQSTALYQPQPAAPVAPAQPVPVPPGAPMPMGAAQSLYPQAESLMPTEPNLMGEALADPAMAGNNCYGGAPGACGPRGDACGDACDMSAECGYSPWYASLSTLVLGRSEGRRLWTSYADQHNVDQLTNTQDIHMPWAWGGEVKLGRRFCGCQCDTWAVEGTFWTTGPMDGYTSTINSTIAPYLVSTPLEVADLTFGGSIAPNWFDGAQEHRLWRHDEFYNAEINLVRMPMFCGCQSPWDIGWGVGVRYFRFQENLTFGSLRNGGVWSDPTAQAYLNDTVTNNLLGAQIGFDLAYRFCQNVRFFISPKVGIFNNNMNQDFRAYLGDGTPGTTPYGDFPVHASRNGLAFLTQVDLGMDWQFSRNWSARVGYRLVAINGAALADDQFPQYIVDLPEIAHIDSHSSLILHGAFVGLTYNF